MGREFTNALNQTPLWQFAIHAYAQHKDALLYWQEAVDADINVLLALAFARKNQRGFTSGWHMDHYLWKTIELTKRIRTERKRCKGKSAYDVALRFELEVEGLQIIRLQQFFKPGSISADIAHYEILKGIKKGALAPFIETLTN
jgi:hypothetical protein